MNSLDSLLASISKENKICYVLGDWNLDLINHHCHETTGEFLEIMYSRMFFPLITRPTRITSNTATLIDNIFTNNLNNFSVSGLMFWDISDHLPIFTLLLDQNKDLIKLLGFLFVTKVQIILLSLKIGLQRLLGMNCLSITTQIALIGVSLINLLPYTITAFLSKN